VINIYCLEKWYYATVWLNTGQTTACHHPLPHQIDANEVLKNPKLLSNTPQKKKERAEMQKGIQCKGCDYCWRVENLKADKISDRVYKSVLYTDEDLQKAYESDPSEDFDLRYLELSFDRACNFACSYCNPAFSTTWAKDIKTHGGYKDIGPNGDDHYGHSHKNTSQFDEDNNPYVEAFFKWWESDLKKTLTHLRLTGGEPLMSKHTWKLLDLMAEGDSNVSYFAINTNLNSKELLIDKLIEKAKTIKGLHIYSSNESMGDKAEYIRDGLDWDMWVENFEKVAKSGSFSSMHSMCTIGALSLEGLVEYLDWCLETKRKANSRDAVTFTLNILRFPNFQSCLVLPFELRQKFASDLSGWLANNKNSELLHNMEIEQVERLIEYLQNETNQITNRENVVKWFKNYFTQYDKRRGKDFEMTFPIIGEWYNGI
jgi:organic radical activating enzyme